MKTRLFLLLLVAACSPAQDTFQGVQRIVAIGDIHGDYARLVELLRTANLIDKQNHWSGGASHLVMDGDFVDRGPDTRKVMDLLMALEGPARDAGGAVHAVLGNHEAMAISWDFRYVSKADFESFRTPDSERQRDAALKEALDELKKKGAPPDLDKLRKQFPLGAVERRLAFGPGRPYGQWLRRQNAIIKIGDVVFVHGGISPKYLAATRQEINDEVRAELDDTEKRAHGMLTAEDGPLWYRGFVTSTETSLTAHVDQVLKAQQAAHIVIAHTPLPAILPRFAGEVIAIDVALSSAFHPQGPPAFLVIEGGKFYVMHRGKRIDLPVDGRGVLQYLREVLLVDPRNAALRKMIPGNTR